MRCLYVCVGALYFGEMTILETWLSQHMILQTLHVHTWRDWWKWPTPYSNHLSKSPELDLRVLMLPPIHPYSQLIPGHRLKSAGEFFTSKVIPGSYPFTEIWSSASPHRLFWNYSSWVLEVTIKSPSPESMYAYVSAWVSNSLIHRCWIKGAWNWCWKASGKLQMLFDPWPSCFMLISLVHVVFSDQCGAGK